jgi:hypothetical protein
MGGGRHSNVVCGPMLGWRNKCASSGRKPTWPGGGVGQRVRAVVTVGVGSSLGCSRAETAGVLFGPSCSAASADAWATRVTKLATTGVSAGGIRVGVTTAVHAESINKTPQSWTKTGSRPGTCILTRYWLNAARISFGVYSSSIACSQPSPCRFS